MSSTFDEMSGTTSGIQVVSVTDVARELVAQDNNRVALIISPPQTTRITLSFDSTVTDLNGIVLNAGESPLMLSVVLHGAAVKKAIYAISPVATTNTIGIITVSQ